MVVASDFGTGQVFLSMLYFFLFFIWIWLLIIVFSDIFRSHDMGGFAKAMWVIFVIILPYLGVLVYLIARGHKMQEHAMAAAQAQDAAFKQAVQQAAGTSGQHRRRARPPRRPQGERHHHRRRVRAGEGQGARRRLSQPFEGSELPRPHRGAGASAFVGRSVSRRAGRGRVPPRLRAHVSSPRACGRSRWRAS